MRTPPMPHRMVSQSGTLSRSPGATSLPSSPMIVPPMSAHRMALIMRGVLSEVPGTSLPQLPMLSTGPASAAEPDLTDDAATDLDVSDARGRHQDPAVLGVGEREDPAGGNRLGEELLHVLRGLVGLEGELSGGVQDADLDLHGSSLGQGWVRGRAVSGQCSSVSG